MGILYILLRIIHALYSLFLLFHSCWRSRTPSQPQELKATRRRLPNHLALLLATTSGTVCDEEAAVCMESVENAVEWCRELGIERLTVYDNQGVISQRAHELRSQFTDPCHDELSSDSELEYPLTPPLSETSASRSLSPELYVDQDLSVTTLEKISRVREKKSTVTRNVMKRRQQKPEIKSTSPKPLKMHIISRDSSKPAIASATRALFQLELQNRTTGRSSIDIETLDSILEGDRGFPSPDLMIIHPTNPLTATRTPLELHGFPPWQMRLTELYHNPHPTSTERFSPLRELDFREALDEFAMAEMRVGK